MSSVSREKRFMEDTKDNIESRFAKKVPIGERLLYGCKEKIPKLILLSFNYYFSSD